MIRSHYQAKGSLFLIVLLLTNTLAALADTTFVKFGSSWNYLDIGAAAPTGAGAADWRNVGFNDATWSNGLAEMGYGDNDERTVVSFGGNPASKYITTYFRKIVNIPDISLFGSIRLNTYIDDGAVIYVNGVEVARSNMPGGAPGFGTLASSSAAENGNTIISFDITTAAFVSGNNLIAVEVHQNSATSSDLSFDLELIAKPAGGSSAIFNYGSVWKYLDDGSDQGTAWSGTGYSDAAWASGPGELGYGDGDETTVVSFGGNASNKYITTYFRKTVNITGLAGYSSFQGKIVRDDGVVVYVNGVEVYRNNITDPLSYTRLATSAIEDAEFTFSIPPGNFVEGNNVIAVEIHQANVTSSDISFDMELTGIPLGVEPDILRGPLLQMVSSDAITIKWKTSAAADSRIIYGTSENSLTTTVTDGTSVTDHEVRITGLTPDTKYFYALGTTGSIITGSYRNYFITAPPVSTTRKIRIGVFGDPGTGNANQKATRDGYLEAKQGTNNSEIALFLGDNAYNGGFENEHQTNFFDIYDDNVFNNHVIFPVPGNHEYNNSGTLANSHAIPYYDIFTVPTAAESGGTASGTEHYYSFDYGNIHFIMLDSYGSDGGKFLYDSTGDQAIWLKNDLAATAGTHKWTIVCLHHPPYTNGTHFSNSESDLIAIRQQITPILERFGVDIVLAGHSHVYERSFLVQGHTGNSGSFIASAPPAGNQTSNSSAKYDGSANSCPYFTIDSATTHGTVYVVAGSAGQIGGGTNAQFPLFYYRNYSGTSGGEVGILYLEVEDNRLDAKFVGGSGTVRDQFTIMKDVNLNRTMNVVVNTPTLLTASWVGGYNWFDDPTMPVSVLGNNRDFNVTPNSLGNFTYYATDSLSPGTTCIADTFTLQVFASLPVTVTKFEAFNRNNKGIIQWTSEQEINTDYFTIERSSNGRDFEMIMMVRATGSINKATDYEFQDNYLQEGNNYYRLISTDKDGSSKIIGIRLVVYKINRSFTLSIKPNPAVNSQVSTAIQSSKRQLLKIRVFDTRGAEVYSKNMTVNAGSNNLSFHILPGTYILNVEAQDGSRLNEKILVK